MTTISPSATVPSTIDRITAPFYFMNAVFSAGTLYSSAKKYFQDRNPRNCRRVFADSLYACSAVTSSLYWANAVQWISLAVPFKLERTLNFSAFLIRAGLGEHTLRIPDINNDPHPLIRLAYEVTSVVYAVLELVALFYTSYATTVLKTAFLITSFSLLGIGTYYLNSSAPPNATTSPAPASV